MSSTPLLFRILNPIMKTILRSPLHGLMSKRIMVIRFTGRKSGKAYETPVSYFRENGSVVCFTHGHWWRNLSGGRPVSLRIDGKDVQGSAESFPDDEVIKSAALTKMMKAVPSDAAFYKVTFGPDGEPNPDEIRKAAADAVMIRVALED